MRIYLMVLTLLYSINAWAVSMAYKLFTSQPTQNFKSPTKDNKKHSLTTSFFNEYVKRTDGFRVNYMGALESYIYRFDKSYYVRVNGGLANLQEWIPSLQKLLEETRIEDITLTFGKPIAKTDHIILTPSLFLGIPLHKMPSRLDPKVGFCQAGIGFQLDGALQIDDVTNIISGGRLVYLMPRSFHDQGTKFTFTLGNIADFILGIRNRWIHHEYGVGYKFSSLGKGAVFPYLPPLTEQSTFAGLLPLFSPFAISRFNVSISSFYAVYKYKFSLHGLPNKILIKLVYGFPNGINDFRLNKFVTTWATWNIEF